jgi:general secretion pathway protein D
VPIVTQQSQSTVASNAPLVNTVELRDTGVILKVTPRVNDNGTVTLDIAQEVSEVAKTTTSGIDSPTISQRRLTSTIATRSGEMVALGGLIRENIARTRQGFPILSQIPLLGAAFGQHTTSGDRTELIILLTPVVMHSPEEAHSALDELLGRMQAVHPVLDDAVDRTPPRATKH